MGTVVLFPQDCLPLSKSRQRSSFSDAFNEMWMPSDIALQPSASLYAGQARRSATSYNVAEPLYPYRSRTSSGLPQRDSEQMKPKARNSRGPNEGKAHSMLPAANFAVLQRSEGSTSMFDVEKMKEVRFGIKSGRAKPCKAVHNVLLGNNKKKMGSDLKKGIFDLKSAKVEDCNVGRHLQGSGLTDQVMPGHFKEDHCKTDNTMRRFVVKHRRSCDDALILSKVLNHVFPDEVGTEMKCWSPHDSGNISPNMAFLSQTSRFDQLENASTKLRRASTDPHLVKHLGHYQSQALEIPGSSVSTITRTSSMPPSERWAGPAYSASPAPSSLPLPKFSFLGQKVGTLHTASTTMQQKVERNLPQEFGVMLKTRVPVHAEEIRDVAFATMSLRRMLKLDLP